MMKRSILVLMLLLILGVVTTLGVAWACAAWVEMNGTGQIESVEIASDRWETTLIKKRFGHTQISFISGRVRYDPESGGMVSGRDAQSDAQYEQRLLAGWPWRALACTREVAALFIEGRFGYFMQRQAHTPTKRGIELAMGGPMGAPFGWRALPYDPIWPGLIANTMVYAALWWLLLFGPFILRKRLRLWRGRCPRCAYDLRGDLPRGCPECGWGRES